MRMSVMPLRSIPYGGQHLFGYVVNGVVQGKVVVPRRPISEPLLLPPLGSVPRIIPGIERQR